ncbi:hypothetical protein SEVIR_9G315101v4 [Setaria viridis]
MPGCIFVQLHSRIYPSLIYHPVALTHNIILGTFSSSFTISSPQASHALMSAACPPPILSSSSDGTRVSWARELRLPLTTEEAVSLVSTPRHGGGGGGSDSRPMCAAVVVAERRRQR